MDFKRPTLIISCPIEDSEVQVEAEILDVDYQKQPASLLLQQPSSSREESSADTPLPLHLPPLTLAPTTPPPPPTPLPPATAPRRRQQQRRRRAQTPFDRVASKFVAVERRRLILEKLRERNLHEREVQRIEIEAQTIHMLKRVLEMAEKYFQTH